MSRKSDEMKRTMPLVKKLYDGRCPMCGFETYLIDSHILRRGSMSRFKTEIWARVPLCGKHDMEMEHRPDGTLRPWSMRVLWLKKGVNAYDKRKMMKQINELLTNLREYKNINGSIRN